MGILEVLFTAFILSMPLGEVARLQTGSIVLRLNDIFIFVLAIVWLFKNFNKLKEIKKRSLFIPIALFSFVGFISLFLNSNLLSVNTFLISFLYLIRWIIYSTLYFIVFNLKKDYIKKIPYILVTSSAIFILFGYVQFSFYENLKNLYYLGWDEHLYRMFSTFLDPNFAGAYFVLSFILICGLFYKSLEKKNTKDSSILGAIGLFNFFAIYLTYSRSALLMLLSSLVIFILYIRKVKFVAVVITILLLSVFVVPKSFKTEGTNIFRIASSEARLESASNAITIIKDNVLIGVGFNAFRDAQKRYGFIKGENLEETHSGGGTDNSFLFSFATTGVIGFSIVLYLILRIFKLGILSKNTPLSLVLISSLGGLLINSMFINSFYYVFIMEWVWILAATTENS